MRLSKKEEELMEMLWKSETAFLKDLVELFPQPRPAVTTLATLLKRMQDKGFVGYKLYGNSREYFPLVKKADYFSKELNGIIKNFFNDSAIQFASFFAKGGRMSQAELEDLKKIVDQELQKQKK